MILRMGPPMTSRRSGWMSLPAHPPSKDAGEAWQRVATFNGSRGIAPIFVAAQALLSEDQMQIAFIQEALESGCDKASLR
jgi:hypothetical protein